MPGPVRKELVQQDRLTLPAAVVFDVGDTLLREVRFDLEAGIRAALPDSLRDRAAPLAHAFRDESREAHASHGELMLASWLRHHVSELQEVEEERVEDAIWSEVVTLLPMEGAGALLHRLRGDGVRIGAISNAYFSGRVLHRELERHGLADSLEIVLSSGDLGIRKPDARIYLEVLERLGVTAETTWYVGDTFEEDIVGAAGAGLVPIWFHAGPASRDLVLPIRQVQDWTEFASLYEPLSVDG
jgi:HAD superfamily hydrolase (TIGR01549 family)